MSLIPNTYTVESVTSGHPDKICDRISDAILDACLEQDSMSRVAVEVLGSRGLLVIAGEITTEAKVDHEGIAKKVYQETGYGDDLKVITHISEQSPDISQGVDTGGAGDQGIMYGFATNETEQYLPKGNVIAHGLAKELEEQRVNGGIPWLKPDGKTQVTMTRDGLLSLLISCQHDDNVSQKQINEELINKVILPTVGDTNDIEILINPTGSFTLGGFEADTGLTGRKIMVDTYGGFIPHGGGCFSGKDATKVDRSAAYMCRLVAKNLVYNDFANECMVSVAYAIGRAEPMMVNVWDEKGNDLSELATKNFDFRPQAIVERLGLRNPIFVKTAAYGHFGRPDFPWETLIQL